MSDDLPSVSLLYTFECNECGYVWEGVTDADYFCLDHGLMCRVKGPYRARTEEEQWSPAVVVGRTPTDL